jgi:hypothetical protein
VNRKRVLRATIAVSVLVLVFSGLVEVCYWADQVTQPRADKALSQLVSNQIEEPQNAVVLAELARHKVTDIDVRVDRQLFSTEVQIRVTAAGEQYAIRPALIPAAAANGMIVLEDGTDLTDQLKPALTDATRWHVHIGSGDLVQVGVYGVDKREVSRPHVATAIANSVDCLTPLITEMLDQESTYSANAASWRAP